MSKRNHMQGIQLPVRVPVNDFVGYKTVYVPIGEDGVLDIRDHVPLPGEPPIDPRPSAEKMASLIRERNKAVEERDKLSDELDSAHHESDNYRTQCDRAQASAAEYAARCDVYLAEAKAAVDTLKAAEVDLAKTKGELEEYIKSFNEQWVKLQEAQAELAKTRGALDISRQERRLAEEKLNNIRKLVK